MYRIDDATAATSLPTPETAGSEGYYTEGNPVAGTPATSVRASWLNMIQEELRAVVVAGGLTPSKTTYTQVRDAIKELIQGGAGIAPVVGSARNLLMNVPAASASASLNADELVVGSALGGQKYILGPFSKPINLATAAAGGMDTGSAPASGYVALYAIYNPTTGASALLATNATSAVQPNVYGGANMPAGFTASALVSVWPTNSSGQFVVGSQRDRKVARSSVLVLSTTSTTSTTALNVASAIPPNAVTCSGILEITVGTSGTAPTVSVFANAQSCGQQISDVLENSSTLSCPFNELIVSVTSTIYYNASTTAGTSTYAIRITAYTI